MSQLKALQAKIDSGKARVGVIGLGYVGLPLAVEFAEAGFKVTGIDLDQVKVDGLSAGRSHVEDVPSSVVMELVRKRLVHRPVTTSRAAASSTRSSSASRRRCARPRTRTSPTSSPRWTRSPRKCVAGQLIVLESTTYPGTTEEVMRPRWKPGGLKVGKDFFLAFSPERVDPGQPASTRRSNTPKVVGGVHARAAPGRRRCSTSQAIEHVHPVSSTQVAEMIKLLENTFRAVNIGLVNEIALMCEQLDLDVWEVIDGAATKPFGFMPFYPGPGIGGHCIPLDPHYLSWKLKTLNYSARFIELASEINSNMPRSSCARPPSC